MMKINITILEDSVSEFNRLQKEIQKYSKQNNLDINIDAYKSGEEFFSHNPNCHSIDSSAFFLDIQMGRMTGIDVAKNYAHPVIMEL